jgi:hypothetical protein
MRSRWVRLIIGLAAPAAFGAAAFFVNLSEQHIARSHNAERVFSGAGRDAVMGLADLRISQAAYVATGQDVAFWAPKAAAAAESVAGSITLLRSTATTDAAHAALDAAAAKAAEFAAIDRRARDYLDQGTQVTSSCRTAAKLRRPSSDTSRWPELSRNKLPRALKGRSVYARRWRLPAREQSHCWRSRC